MGTATPFIPRSLCGCTTFLGRTTTTTDHYLPIHLPTYLRYLLARRLLGIKSMPKHYCDYCDVFLTHDSASVRKAHNSGRNHLQNVRDYYASLGHDKAQDIIDQITKAYESGLPPGGAGFGVGALGPAPGMPGMPGMPPMGMPGMPPPPPGMMPPPGMFPGGMPPPPPGMIPPPGMGMGMGMGAPPFPPNNAPFNPSGMPMPFSPTGPPQGGASSYGASTAPGSGPAVHPDRLRMMQGGR
ncbi:zf-U1-domain-containing protein, partial [Calocera viscosa TUFC12733]